MRVATELAAALRAMEIKAEVILKGTKVDGVYTADPMLDPAATKYPAISYLQVLEKQLKVMDSSAISLCMDTNLPIMVFNMTDPGNIIKAVGGDTSIGTLVGPVRQAVGVGDVEDDPNFVGLGAPADSGPRWYRGQPY